MYTKKKEDNYITFASEGISLKSPILARPVLPKAYFE